MSSLILDSYSKQFLTNGDYPQLQLANLWALELVGFPYGDLLIQEITLPLHKISTNKTLFEVLIPEQRENFSEVSISFYDTPSLQGYTFFRDWLDHIYDYDKMLWRNGFQYQKKSATLKFLTLQYATTINGAIQDFSENNSKYEVLKSFTLQGMLITGISDLNLESLNGDPLTFEVTAQIENVI